MDKDTENHLLVVICQSPQPADGASNIYVKARAYVNEGDVPPHQQTIVFSIESNDGAVFIENGKKTISKPTNALGWTDSVAFDSTSSGAGMMHGEWKTDTTANNEQSFLFTSTSPPTPPPTPVKVGLNDESYCWYVDPAQKITTDDEKSDVFTFEYLRSQTLKISLKGAYVVVGEDGYLRATADADDADVFSIYWAMDDNAFFLYCEEHNDFVWTASNGNGPGYKIICGVSLDPGQYVSYWYANRILSE